MSAARALAFILIAVSGCATPLAGAGSQPCAIDSDCAGGYVCFPDHHCYPRGAIVECSPKCRGATLCDPVTLMCVSCLGDKDCPVGRVCVAGVCRMGCSGAHPACAVDAGSCDVDLGACRGCIADNECSDAKLPRCDKPSGHCVPCLPMNDNCAVGHYCVANNAEYACVPGCKADAECAADGGAGAACCNHACADTTADNLNCAGCGMACNNGLRCCLSRCVDYTSDPKNCGGCGTACQFPNAMAGCAMLACTIGSCNQGFADCDKDPQNGCEAMIASDPKNCGGCGQPCPNRANTTAMCANGTCSYTCQKGFADCDMNPQNGCEANLAADANNCSACGKACPAIPNAMTLCNGGVCVLGMCNPGFRDCNNDIADGCEVNVANDINNCGTCANACGPIANGTVGCVGGKCSAIGCNPGFGDCNMNGQDGCEANLTSDLKNCGACGRACGPYANATAGCIAGQCNMVCLGNFADCDSNLANGCEVNVFTDAKNCGGCAKACGGGQMCVNAVCVGGGGCLAGGKVPPAQCVNGKDMETNAAWTVCSADCNTAWISMGALNGGTYHALQICQSLGYTKLGQMSGTCNKICGYCGMGNWTCQNHGLMQFDGGGGCGMDQFGPKLCIWVMWTCLK